MIPTRPMLAAKLFNKLDYITDELVEARLKMAVRFPVIATPKADGIRGIVGDCLLSRTYKPLPNRQLQERAKQLPKGFDVECFSLGLPYDQIESIVMSADKDASLIEFVVIDWFGPHDYWQRLKNVNGYMPAIVDTRVRMLDFKLCKDVSELLDFEQECLALGYEGICFRAPDGPYKEGRATLKEGYLTKLKRVRYEEATIIGFIEECENLNPQQTDAFGLSKRSSHQDNKIGKGILGAFEVSSVFGLHRVSGFTNVQKVTFWQHRDELVGKRIRFKFTPHGTKDLPRHPIFKEFLK